VLALRDEDGGAGSNAGVRAPVTARSTPARAARIDSGAGASALRRAGSTVRSNVVHLAAGAAPADLLRLPGIGRFRLICDREQRPFVSFQVPSRGATVVGGIDGAARAAGARALEIDPGDGLTVEPDGSTISQFWTLGHLGAPARASAAVSIGSIPTRGSACDVAARATLRAGRG
jgi:hypothetical protein